MQVTVTAHHGGLSINLGGGDHHHDCDKEHGLGINIHGGGGGHDGGFNVQKLKGGNGIGAFLGSKISFDCIQINKIEKKIRLLQSRI